MLKKVILFVLFFSFIKLDGQYSPIEPVEQPSKSLWMRASTPCIVSCLAFLYWMSAPQIIKDRFTDQLTPTQLALNFLTEYGTRAFVTLAHELGHASAGYGMTGRWGTIHLGATTHTTQPLISFGNIHIDGHCPTQGHTEQVFIDSPEKIELAQQFLTTYCLEHGLDYTNLSPEQAATIITSTEFHHFVASLVPSPKQYALFLLAGPLAGLVVYHWFKALAGKDFGLDSITMTQIINAFLPFAKNSDGAALWRDCIGVYPATIAIMIYITVFIDLASELYFAVSDPRSSPQTLLHSKLLIGLINYFSRGYLRFYA